MSCTCAGGNFDVVIIRDMSDKNFIVREYPQHRDAKFVFLKDAEHQVTGWTPEHVYFSVWGMEAINDDPGISSMLSHLKAKGSRVVCLGN
jgi:DNA primase catalytic subunit